jgi:hypothetical protein
VFEFCSTLIGYAGLIRSIVSGKSKQIFFIFVSSENYCYNDNL